MKVADERRFRDYRTDVALDVRQMRVALKRLRQLTRTGLATELDLDETIDETCRNAGEIEMVFRRAEEERRPAPPADGRRRHDGPLLRADEPAADGAARRARAPRVPPVLLPQLRLRPRLLARPADPRRRGTDRRPAARASTSAGSCWSSATRRCIRPSCSKATAASIPTTPRRRPASPGCSASPGTSTAPCGSTPTSRSSGTTPTRPASCSGCSRCSI